VALFSSARDFLIGSPASVADVRLRSRLAKAIHLNNLVANPIEFLYILVIRPDLEQCFCFVDDGPVRIRDSGTFSLAVFVHYGLY
jgi:hypothetical protein